MAENIKNMVFSITGKIGFLGPTPKIWAKAMCIWDVSCFSILPAPFCFADASCGNITYWTCLISFDDIVSV